MNLEEFINNLPFTKKPDFSKPVWKDEYIIPGISDDLLKIGMKLLKQGGHHDPQPMGLSSSAS